MDARRTALIGDAAISVLAAGGMRGLTHRAVDRAAGLAEGSTSYYARTRAALIELVLERTVDLDQADITSLDLADLDSFSELIAEFLHSSITAGRLRALARYELALEVTRRPELREYYDRAATRLRAPAVTLLTAAGSVEPQRHARMLVTFCDGLLFDSVAGLNRDHPPTTADLRAGLREFLSGILAR